MRPRKSLLVGGVTPFREYDTPSELVQCSLSGAMLPKWCNAPLQVQRVVNAGGRVSYGAADVLVGVSIRIGYEHPDRLCACG